MIGSLSSALRARGNQPPPRSSSRCSLLARLGDAHHPTAPVNESIATDWLGALATSATWGRGGLAAARAANDPPPVARAAADDRGAARAAAAGDDDGAVDEIAVGIQ